MNGLTVRPVDTIADGCHNSWKQPKTLAHGPNAHVSFLLQRGARGTWGIASPSMPLPVTLVN